LSFKHITFLRGGDQLTLISYSLVEVFSKCYGRRKQSDVKTKAFIEINSTKLCLQFVPQTSYKWMQIQANLWKILRRLHFQF